jgi:hypothetical protein
MPLKHIITLFAGLLGLTSTSAAAATAAGYLAAVFEGNVPSVFFHLAPPESPSTFKPLNGRGPSLVPTKGTRGARDPYILSTEDGSKVKTDSIPAANLPRCPMADFWFFPA